MVVDGEAGNSPSVIEVCLLGVGHNTYGRLGWPYPAENCKQESQDLRDLKNVLLLLFLILNVLN